MARLENGRQSFDTRSIRTVSSSHTHLDDESSLGSDSEINGFTSDRQTDKYGFIGGAQQYSEESAQDVPTEVLRQREVKWLDMLNHWDKWMVKRHSKVRLRCQKGIPPALRGRAWLYLSGGKVKREQNQGKFQELDSEPGDPKWLDVIEKDLHRQFPFHEMFVSRGGHGQQDLFRVLKAYTLYRPEEGYCQAQAPIAAVLLMHMPAEDAFWGLVQICEKYLPGYYSPGLEAIQLDGEILNALLRRVCPLAYRHLEKHKIEPILYMTEWFMCAFSRTLPWASVLRVWDMFLCDGVKIIFRVGLVLLKCMMGTREKLKASQGQYETMELLKTIEPRYLQEGFLVREIVEVPVSVRDVEKENHSQLKRWRKNRGELNFKSPPRMHGARAIMVAEPPSRQDLRQNPTIIVEPPQPTPQLKKAERKSKKEEEKRIKEEKKNKKKRSIRKSSQPINEIPNPYPLPSVSQLPLTEPPVQLPVISETPLDLPQTVRDLPPQDLPQTVRDLPPLDLPQTVRDLPPLDLPQTVRDLPPLGLPQTVRDLPPLGLPQTVRDLPPLGLPQTVRDLPPQDLPQTVRDLPPLGLPQTVRDLPPLGLPQTVRDLPPQDLPQTVRDLPPLGLPQTVRDLPPLDLPQTVRDLPPLDLPQTVRDLPPLDLPQTVRDLPPLGLPQTVRDLPPLDLPQTVRDLPPLDLPQTVRDLPPQDLPQTMRDLPPLDLPQTMRDLPPQDLPQTVRDLPPQDLPQTVRDLPPQDLPQTVRDLPPQDLPQTVRDIAPLDLPQLVTDLPPQVLPHTMTEPPAQQPSHKDPSLAKESPLQKSTQSLSSTEQDTYL